MTLLICHVAFINVISKVVISKVVISNVFESIVIVAILTSRVQIRPLALEDRKQQNDKLRVQIFIALGLNVGLCTIARTRG
jgi:hypothetical protein